MSKVQDLAAYLSNRSLATLFTVFVLFLIEVLLLQWLNGAYSSGFGGHPDEAAHFVSGLMVREFFNALSEVSPLAFAQTYYLHYPKVAIGNWPPLMYAIAALWFVVLGVSRASALVFVACIASATSVLLFMLLRKLLTPAAGLFAGFVYLALPLVQESSAMFMSEHMVTFLIFASAMLFARFAEAVRLSDAILFGLCATAAILTRGSAWALIFVPPIVIILTRRWSLMWNWRIWLGATPVFLLCVPWYFWATGINKGAMTGLDPNNPFAFFLDAIVQFPFLTAAAAGPVLIFLLLVGCIRYARLRGQSAAYWHAALGMIIAILLIQSIVPASIEKRFMVQVMPALVMLAAGGLSLFLSWLPAPLLNQMGRRSSVWTLAVVLALFPVFALSPGIRNSGYDAASLMVLEKIGQLKRPAILVVSDSIGEGSVIASLAAKRPTNKLFCLRGSKILTSEDWLGRDSKDRITTNEELSDLLDRIPADVVLVDAAIDPFQKRPYHGLVASFMEMHPETWKLGGAFDAVRRGNTLPAAIHVFFRIRDDDNAMPAQTDIGLITRLMQQR